MSLITEAQLPATFSVVNLLTLSHHHGGVASSVLQVFNLLTSKSMATSRGEAPCAPYQLFFVRRKEKLQKKRRPDRLSLCAFSAAA
jgi:hypothetical protein